MEERKVYVDEVNDSGLRNLHSASISKRGLSWALQMPGLRDSVDLHERISTIGTIDAKWRSYVVPW